MVAPLQIEGGITIGGGITVETSGGTPPAPAGPPWYSTSGNYLAQYTSTGDGTGSIVFYCLNCTNQEIDPVGGFGYLTYFQVWVRTLATPFSAYDATLNNTYTINPQSSPFSMDGGQTYTFSYCLSSAPTLSNITTVNN